MTRYEHYLEAVRFLDEAVNAIDQANACLKSAKVEAQAGGYRHPTHKELFSDAESLLVSLKASECDDCSRPLIDCRCAWLRSEVA